MMTLEQRIRKLERQNHVWRLFSTALLLLILVVFAVGAARSTGRDLLKAKKLVIQDDKGRERAVIRMAPAGDRMEEGSITEARIQFALYGPDKKRSSVIAWASALNAGTIATSTLPQPPKNGNRSIHKASLHLGVGGGLSAGISASASRSDTRGTEKKQDSGICSWSCNVTGPAVNPAKADLLPNGCAQMQLMGPGLTSASALLSGSATCFALSGRLGHSVRLNASAPAVEVCQRYMAPRAVLGAVQTVRASTGDKIEKAPSSLTLFDAKGNVIRSLP